MDIVGIITGLLPYAIIAFALAVLAAGAILFIYHLYRKRGGTRTIYKGQFLAFFLLLGWFVVVMGITTFSRGGNYAGWFNFRLFSGYINAWNNWSLSEAQLIIFNMLMFMPLGFLLPLLAKRQRRFGPTLLLSLSATVFIELFQMLTRRGIFELDDIFHNTLGSIAGYFIIMAVLTCMEKRKLLLRPVLRALAIPLVFVLLFSGAAVVYQTQEFGNMPIIPAIPQSMKGVVLESTVEFPDAAEPVPLYHNSNIHNVDYMKQMAALLEDTFALQREGGIRVDGSNRLIAYRDDRGQQYYYTFLLADGSWSLTHVGCSELELPQGEAEEYIDFFEKWLGENRLLPEDAVFTIQNNAILRWDAPAQNGWPPADHMSGQIMVTPSLDTDLPCTLWYFMARNEFIGMTSIISPAQAYEKVLAGQFKMYNDLMPGDHIIITSYELVYSYDTKGYYWPIYHFEGTVNGHPWGCDIPARK